MKRTLTTTQAAEILRADKNANWSPAGALALVEYLEELEDSTGQEIELDAVALRCEFSEYECLENWASEYFSDTRQAAAALGLDLGMDGEIDCGSEEIAQSIREYIRDRGELIEFDGGVIVSSF